MAAKRKAKPAEIPAPAPEVAAEAVVVECVKGFDRALKCRNFQYAVGETYKHDGKVKACEGGFHACENPLDVFQYYAPANSRFAVVEMRGEMSREVDGDSKLAAAEITIRAEIGIPEVVSRAVRYILGHIEKPGGSNETGDQSAATNTGYQSAATNTGYQSAATNTGDRSAATNTGYQSAATNTGYRSAATNTGDRSAATNTGYQSAATNTGYQSAATNTGDRSAATNTGYQSAATNTGYQSAATNTGDRSAATNTGDRSAATNTGDRSAATNTGYQSAATNTGDRSAATNTGYQSAATVEGQHSVAVASGYGGKAAACAGSAIMLVERNDDGEILHVFAGIAGRDEVKPGTMYTLTGGKLTEVQP